MPVIKKQVPHFKKSDLTEHFLFHHSISFIKVISSLAALCPRVRECGGDWAPPKKRERRAQGYKLTYEDGSRQLKTYETS